jgi:hypothetical protein
MFYIMASKLDPFFDVLFDQLNNQGLSYRSVCNNLLSMGVEISAQSLRSWHVRRSRKIAARLSAMPRLEGYRTATAPPSSSALPPRRPPSTHLAQKATSPSKPNTLRREIDAQEQGLATTPFTHQSLGFLVRPKPSKQQFPSIDKSSNLKAPK